MKNHELLSTNFKGKTIAEAMENDEDFLYLVNLLNFSSVLILHPLDKLYLEEEFKKPENINKLNRLNLMYGGT